MEIKELLEKTLEAEASDMHLIVELPPMMRVHGHIQKTNYEILTAESNKEMLYKILSEEQIKVLENEKELDLAYHLPGKARFRVNIFYQRKGLSAAFRTIPMKIRTIQELGMPDVLAKVTERARGLVLVTGPTGSGKTTTLAAMIDHVNRTRCEHIITVEEPIEYVHEPQKCIINQREVKVNTKSFANALRASLREDPDIIMVGEMRDLETIALAITAAETGHLVFGTLHTSSAPKTCDRLIDVFPPEQQNQIRTMFSESIVAVLCQALIPKKDGTGRVAALEIMIGTQAVKGLIREGKTYQLSSVIQTSKQVGMQSLDQDLRDLVMKGVIAKEEATKRANNPSIFEQP
jgi:twitching motility protein PilT